MSIELNNIVMSFGARELFSTEHLFIAAGSRIGIVGDNGSGKSTLLALIEGKVTPDKGTITRHEEVSMIRQLIDDTTTNSGGEQTKQRIRDALSSNKGILLADEPTNHLDEKGIAFLERKLADYQGTLLVVSHNRSFLNKTVDNILEIQQGKLTLFEGNYEAYLTQKEQLEREQARAYEKYQKERQQIKKAMRAVSNQSDQTRKAPRRMGNSEARLHKMGDQRAKKNLDNKVKALNTRLGQLEKIEKPKTKKELVIPLTTAQKIHRKVMIEANHFNLSLGKKRLFSDAEFKLFTGSKTALTGINGSGKTSLFKEIISKNASITYAHGVKIGYFSQTFENLINDQTVFENVSRQSVHEEQRVRDLLAHMQFRGESIFNEIATLSGGERSKVAISQLLLGDYNLLLLDEPTNHLDISSIKVLEEALCAYQGTILFISHDQQFIENVATKKWKIESKKVKGTQKQLTNSENQKAQEKLLLENRKTTLMSDLSFADEHKKRVLEEELQKVLLQLKKV